MKDREPKSEATNETPRSFQIGGSQTPNSISRREFLKIGSTAAATVLLSRVLTACDTPSSNTLGESKPEATKEPVVKFLTQIAQDDVWERIGEDKKIVMENGVVLETKALQLYGNPTLITLSPQDESGNVNSSIQEGFGILSTTDSNQVPHNVAVMCNFDVSTKQVKSYFLIKDVEQSTDSKSILKAGNLENGEWKDSGFRIIADLGDENNPKIFLENEKGEQIQLVDTPEFKEDPTPEPNQPREIINRFLGIGAIDVKAAEVEIPDEVASFAQKLGLIAKAEDEQFAFYKSQDGTNPQGEAVLRARKHENSYEAFFEMTRTVMIEDVPKQMNFELASGFDQVFLDKKGNIVSTVSVAEVGSAEFKYGESGWEISKGVLVFVDGEFKTSEAATEAEYYKNELTTLTPVIYHTQGWKSNANSTKYFDQEKYTSRFNESGFIFSISAKSTRDGVEYAAIHTDSSQLLPEFNMDNKLNLVELPSTIAIREFILKSPPGVLKDVFVREPLIDIVNVEDLTMAHEIWKIFDITPQRAKELLGNRRIYYTSWDVAEVGSEKYSTIRMFALGDKSVNVGTTMQPFYSSTKLGFELGISKIIYNLNGNSDSPYVNSWFDIPWAWIVHIENSTNDQLNNITNSIYSKVAKREGFGWIAEDVRGTLTYALNKNNKYAYALVSYVFNNPNMLTSVRRSNRNYMSISGAMELKVASGTAQMYRILTHECGHALQFALVTVHGGSTGIEYQPYMIEYLLDDREQKARIYNKYIADNFAFVAVNGDQ